jgi:hypothetical protein
LLKVAVTELASIDQRTHPRVPLVLPATLILPATSQELPCLVTDISGGGAGLHYQQESPSAGLIARLAIEEFGVFDGITARASGGTRGLRFLQGEVERNRLMVKLTLYVEEGLADASRRGRWPTEARLSLARTNGLRERCEVIRISLQGVAVLTEQRPPVGELVNLGRMYGRVAQHLSDGITIRFLSFVQPEENAPTP